jgi:hypothetical protein
MNIIEKKCTTGYHDWLITLSNKLDNVIGGTGRIIGASPSATEGNMLVYWKQALVLYAKYLGGDFPRIDELSTILVYPGEGWAMFGLGYCVNGIKDYVIQIAIEDDLLAVQFKLMI